MRTRGRSVARRAGAGWHRAAGRDWRCVDGSRHDVGIAAYGCSPRERSRVRDRRVGYCGTRHGGAGAGVPMVDQGHRDDANVPARAGARAGPARAPGRSIAAARNHPRGVRSSRRSATGEGRLRRASVAWAAGDPRRARGLELARARATRWTGRRGRSSSGSDRAGGRARHRWSPPRDRAGSRARRGRRTAGRRSGRLPSVGPLPPAQAVAARHRWRAQASFEFKRGCREPAVLLRSLTGRGGV
jgi:hypothetical protein